MSTTRHDQLYQIFEERLHSGEYDEQPTEVFLNDVVEGYWVAIDGAVNVPVRLRENVRTDLLEYARDMLRLKIYGNNGVGEYNRRRSEGKKEEEG